MGLGNCIQPRVFPSILQTLGKVGRVVEVYPDGDMKIAIRDVIWTLNSRNMSRLEGDGVPLTPGTSGEMGIGVGEGVGCP